MSKIIFLGGLFPNELRREIEGKNTGIIQYPADTLQWAIVKGLNLYTDNLQLVNLVFVGSYPAEYLDLKIKGFDFSHDGIRVDKNVGFINLYGYNLVSRYLNAKRCLRSIIKIGDEKIFIYSMHTPFMKAAIDLKKDFPGIKICLYVPDLPEFMWVPKNNIIRRVFKKIDRLMHIQLLKKIDSFVLITKYMHSRLKIGNKPYVIVEGIFNPQPDNLPIEKENSRTIMYSGGLSIRNNILDLLEAFSKIENDDYRLWICGLGDTSERIIEMSKTDKRIAYYGQIPREEVLVLQKRATVLINPRTSEGEFTKYSFPSKTMEYLASGTPCILHRLEGIPEEYFEYCFVPEKETSLALYNTIIKVCEKPQNELNSFGLKAQNFILNYKNPKYQCGKIYQLLNQ